MKKKDIGVILVFGLLVYMALASEKMVVVTEGYLVSVEVIESGRQIYADFCHRCHGPGWNGAPRIADGREWETRIQQGIEPLLARSIGEHRRKKFLPKPGESGLTDEGIAAATAYLLTAAGAER